MEFHDEAVLLGGELGVGLGELGELGLEFVVDLLFLVQLCPELLELLLDESLLGAGLPADGGDGAGALDGLGHDLVVVVDFLLEALVVGLRVNQLCLLEPEFLLEVECRLLLLLQVGLLQMEVVPEQLFLVLEVVDAAVLVGEECMGLVQLLLEFQDFDGGQFQRVLQLLLVALGVLVAALQGAQLVLLVVQGEGELLHLLLELLVQLVLVHASLLVRYDQQFL